MRDEKPGTPTLLQALKDDQRERFRIAPKSTALLMAILAAAIVIPIVMLLRRLAFGLW